VSGIILSEPATDTSAVPVLPNFPRGHRGTIMSVNAKSLGKSCGRVLFSSILDREFGIPISAIMPWDVLKSTEESKSDISRPRGRFCLALCADSSQVKPSQKRGPSRLEVLRFFCLRLTDKTEVQQSREGLGRKSWIRLHNISVATSFSRGQCGTET
jgi:hypothetical protein